MFKYVLFLLLFVLGVDSNAALQRHCSTVNGKDVCVYLDEKENSALNKIRKQKESLSNIEYSCNSGNGINCSSLGWNYEYGVNGYTKDYSKAVHFYRKACELDNGVGCNNLGVLYSKGEGVKKNVPMARIYYDKACKLNNPTGCSNLRNSSSVIESSNDYKRVYVSPIVYMVLIASICGCLWFIVYVLKEMHRILPDFTDIIIIIMVVIVLIMVAKGFIILFVYIFKFICDFISGMF